jgi:hypothetical protein
VVLQMGSKREMTFTMITNFEYLTKINSYGPSD